MKTEGRPPASSRSTESRKQENGQNISEVAKLKGLKSEQIGKAVVALLKHISQQQARAASLLDEDEVIYLCLALVKTPVGGRKDKPITLKIPHPLWQSDGAEVCLIVKDHKGEGHKSAKKRVQEQQITGVSRVMGLSKLRTKYEAPEAKRQLCTSYDVFLADDRILPSLPKAIGKTFFRKKKQPIPVSLSGKDWASEVQKALSATYMYRPSGNSITIRVARSSFSPEQCQENVLGALRQAVTHVPQKWKGIRAIFLKTADSVALPIFQRAPDTGTTTTS